MPIPARFRGTFLILFVTGSFGCENDIAFIAPPSPSASLFASAAYSAPGSNLESVCYVSGTLPFLQWPPRDNSVIVPLYVGRALHNVVALPITRDTVLPAVSVSVKPTTSRHFTLTFGSPLSDTVSATMEAASGPLRVLAWHCPSTLPFLDDAALLSAGYQADSLVNGMLTIRLVIAP
jgi:hypothetical protein